MYSIKNILTTKNRNWELKVKDGVITVENQEGEVYSPDNINEIILQNKIDFGLIGTYLIPAETHCGKLILIKENSEELKQFRQENEIYEKKLESGDVFIASNSGYNNPLEKYIFIANLYKNKIKVRKLLEEGKLESYGAKYNLIYSLERKTFELNYLPLRIFDKLEKDYRFENEEIEIAQKIDFVKEYGFAYDLTKEELAKLELENKYTTTKWTLNKPVRKKDLDNLF